MILIIDDDAQMRQILEDFLQSQGFHVLAAADITSGLEIYSVRRQEVGLIICAIETPNPGGVIAYRRVKAANPSAKMILVSSFFDEATRQALVQDRNVQLLHKPFKGDEILFRIRLALGP